MRWIGRRVRADDGPADPQVGLEAHDVSLSRLPPSSAFRLALLDEQGAVISSIDLERGDVHDLRSAFFQAMQMKNPGGTGG
jgi:hypothetical protein